MQQTILLTGATGFLGANLLKRLISEDYNVIILKRSFSDTFRIQNIINKCRSYDIDKTDLKSIFCENKIDIIIHCATNYGREDKNPLEIIQSNLTFPLELLLLGIENNVKTFINTDTILDKNINHYSLSKKHFNEWLQTYSDRIKVINVALEHFYGALDNETKFTSYVVNNLINKVEELDFTDGYQERDFIYIDDVVSAFMTIIENLNRIYKNYSHFEVGTGIQISIKGFVSLCKELTKNTETKLNFGKIPMRKNEILKYKVNLSELEKLNWIPQYTLKQGLNKMIAGTMAKGEL